MPTTKTYNKLVRDYIPDIIQSSGASCETMTLDQQAYIQALDTKLMEEFGEFRVHRDVEEIADMLEVLFAMAKVHGYSWLDVASAHKEKREKRGGFDRAILLKTVTED